jgi:hypothetical protein
VTSGYRRPWRLGAAHPADPELSCSTPDVIIWDFTQLHDGLTSDWGRQHSQGRVQCRERPGEQALMSRAMSRGSGMGSYCYAAVGRAQNGLFTSPASLVRPSASGVDTWGGIQPRELNPDPDPWQLPGVLRRGRHPYIGLSAAQRSFMPMSTSCHQPQRRTERRLGAVNGRADGVGGRAQMSLICGDGCLRGDRLSAGECGGGRACRGACLRVV